jgi:hypothetical protein
VAHMTAEAQLGAEALGYPHPGCFGKRGCKLLILKDDAQKKRAKRLQLIERKGDSWLRGSGFASNS